MSTTARHDPDRVLEPPLPGEGARAAGASTTCLNCAAPLVGRFCASCGQRALPPEPHLAELIGEAWDAFVNVDGKVARTAAALVAHPGALTAEYLRGRRARYLPPLRLYLACSVMYFLIAALHPARLVRAPSHLQTAADTAALAQRIDSINTSGSNWIARRLATSQARIRADGHNFTPDFSAQTPRLFFVLMPAFALLLAGVYRSRRRPYATHLVVSLHLHAFAFLVFSLSAAALWLPWRAVGQWLDWAIVGWIAISSVIALRRVYGGTVGSTVVRTATLIVAYATAAVVGYAAMALIILLTYAGG